MIPDVYNQTQRDAEFMTEFSTVLANNNPNHDVGITLYRWQIEYLVEQGILVSVPKKGGFFARMFHPKRWKLADGSRPNTSFYRHEPIGCPL